MSWHRGHGRHPVFGDHLWYACTRRGRFDLYGSLNRNAAHRRAVLLRRPDGRYTFYARVRDAKQDAVDCQSPGTPTLR